MTPGKFKITNVAVTVYCECGSSMAVQSRPDAVEAAIKAFASIHKGEGHKPCDAKTCYRNRRKAEEKSVRDQGT